MPGLDPGIHEAVQPVTNLRFCFLQLLMDCRVKPGNDEREDAATDCTKGENDTPDLHGVFPYLVSPRYAALAKSSSTDFS